MNAPSRERFGWLTAGGLGHLRPAPGTWGSLPPVVLAGLLISLGFGPASATPAVYYIVLILILILFSGACVLQGNRAELVWGKDPSRVVADEVAGQAVVLLGIPPAALTTGLRTVGVLVACFLAFRLLDIVKPWPARQIQRVPGAWGILLDDLVAGLYGLALIQIWFRMIA